MDKKLIAMLLIILMAFFAIGCGNEDENKNENDTDNKDGGMLVQTTDEEVFEIETPYCNLYFPTEWEEMVTIEHQKDEPYTVKFYADLDEEIPLFDIVFDGTGEAQLGTLTIEGKEIPVSVVSYNADVSEYSQTQQMDVSGMIYDINVIISKLVEEDNFILA